MSIVVLLDLAFPVDHMLPETEKLHTDKSQLQQGVFHGHQITDAV